MYPKMIPQIFLASFLGIFSAFVAQAAPPLTVSTSLGEYRGEIHKGARLYPNIAYAEPPIGKRRWHRPAPVSSARQNVESVACAQTVHDSLPGGPLPITEDCLYLHVWAPLEAQKVPVVFLLHGGGLLAGTGLKDFYNGSVFTKRGVIFVSFNYRLGELGYGPHLNKEPGALGMMDQAMALRWVVKNIQNFGGDPNQIFLMGHSKGAEAIVALMESGLAGTEVKGGIALSGIRNFDPNSNDFLNPGQITFDPKFHSRPWEEILSEKGFRIYTPEMPSYVPTRSDGHTYKLLVGTIYDERFSRTPTETYCGHAFFLKRMFPYIESYFYVWHSGNKEHGSEMQSLFAEDRFGQRMLDVFVPFVKQNEPPKVPIWGKVNVFSKSVKEVVHVYPYFTLVDKFVDEWDRTSCTDQKKFPGSSINNKLVWIDRLTGFLGDSKFDDESYEMLDRLRANLPPPLSEKP